MESSSIKTNISKGGSTESVNWEEIGPELDKYDLKPKRFELTEEMLKVIKADNWQHNQNTYMRYFEDKMGLKINRSTFNEAFKRAKEKPAIETG